MSKEKRRVPKLRFPGFTEDWEQRKLGEVVTINPKTELPDEFKYVDLESVVGTNLLGFQVIKKENAPSRAQRLASYGDVFYQTVRPYQRNNYLFENVDKDMVFSTGYAQLRSKLDSYFLLTLVQNDNFVKVVLDNCTGTSYPAINGSELGKITVQIPSNEVEANQIGKVFRGIDKSITLHQRKLDNLKLKKKALLQKLFPKNGERYPELRFPGFTDAWEQREFSDIFAEVKSGLSRMLSNDDIGLPVVRANNINDGQLNLVDDIKYWYKNDPQGANTNNYLIEQGDILINFINSEAKMGTAAYVTRRPERDTIYTTNILRCKVNDEYNPYFIYSLTFLNSYKNYIASITKPAVNQASFTTVDFKKYSIKIPTVKEQNQIADLIKTFNKLITLHQRKLDHLQLQKKALLQQMFV